MPETNFFLLALIILLAIGFGFTNGLNDAANAIATAIGTRALSPRAAVTLAAIFNFAGAATGLEVARTIGKGILVPEAMTFLTIIAALISVIGWTAFATYRGLPVSLTHGFVVALAASGAAVVGGQAVVWSVMNRVMAAVVTAPLLGFIGGFIVMVALYWALRRVAPDKIRSLFSKLQIPASAFVAYAHGKNDGQMPVGVITMALVTFYQDPTIWDRLSITDSQLWWVIVVSALAISSGMGLGGRRVIKTVGMRVTNLRPIHGFTAQASAAGVIEVASQLGIPVSTTHCVSSAVMGVGATERFSAVRWGIAGNIVAAWILTFPICGALGYFFSWLLHTIF
ncbi:MAG: inorganic phosphate transporter [Chloroflexi bacterium RBG_16_60_22]|nr:MAG: inorganic phosphate transporter [Chloroflexi bacterium RBG_16_60_22]